VARQRTQHHGLSRLLANFVPADAPVAEGISIKILLLEVETFPGGFVICDDAAARKLVQAGA